MEKFLTKITKDIDEKILGCLSSSGIIAAVEKEANLVVKNKKSKIYNKDQKSVYELIIEEFLRDSPNFFNEYKKEK